MAGQVTGAACAGEASERATAATAAGPASLFKVREVRSWVSMCATYTGRMRQVNLGVAVHQTSPSRQSHINLPARSSGAATGRTWTPPSSSSVR